MGGRKLKGPVFPSYLNQNTPQPKLVWQPGLQSNRQRLRNLMGRCRPVLDSKDPNVIVAGLRVMKMVHNEPEPEYSTLHIIAAGLDLAEEANVSWVEAMNVLLDKWESAEAEQPQEVEIATIVTRKRPTFQPVVDWFRRLRGEEAATR